MTGEKTDVDHRFTNTSPEAEIVAPKHPLAAGLTGASAHLRPKKKGSEVQLVLTFPAGKETL